MDVFKQFSTAKILWVIWETENSICNNVDNELDMLKMICQILFSLSFSCVQFESSK